MRLCGTTRQQAKLAALKQLGIKPILLEMSDVVAMNRLTKISNRWIVLAPPPNHGAIDTNIQNFIRGLKRKEAGAQRFGYFSKRQQITYVSTTGVYGDSKGGLIDETAPLKASTDRAKRRVNAERQLRKACKESGWRANILRAPGIYALERLPIERLRLGTPALLPADDVFTNHIHADDLARLCWVAQCKCIPSRVFNAVDQSHLQMGQYFDLVADHFNLARPPRVSRQELKQLVSPMMLSFMSESRKISNERILRELTLHLSYPTVGDFLATQNRHQFK
jgi:nucleoside-diphosphate-sugar epimerase